MAIPTGQPNRKRNLYKPDNQKPFEISRSKIELFVNCPRCFYLDRVLGIGQPPSFPYTLNSAVDRLLKKEFDYHRGRHSCHPLMAEYGIDAIPFDDEKIDIWRDSLHKGIKYLHQQTNLLITGGVDDVWINSLGELIIVDYKSTSKQGEISLDAEWQDSYKRQMDVYQWIFRKNGYSVSSTSYFVYCNGKTDRDAFNGKLEFDITLIPYLGKTEWIEPTIIDIHKCLNNIEIPVAQPECKYCNYVASVLNATSRN